MGTVRDPAGAPVSGFQVNLHDSVGKFARARVIEGDYFAADLEPGDWWISGSADGWRSVVAEAADLRPGEERRVDLSARRPLVLTIGARTDGGVPLRIPKPKGLPSSKGLTELVPVATREPCGADYPWRVVDSRDRQGVGRFIPRGTAEDDPDIIGRLSLDVDLPAYVALTCYQGVLASSLVAPGQERVNFFVSGPELESRLAGLRFQLAGGAAGGGARPGLMLHGPGIFGIPLSNDGEQTELLGLPPGEYALVSPAAGLHHSFVLTAGDVLDLGSIGSMEPREVRATCRFPDGSPARSLHDDARIQFAIQDGRGGAHMDESFQLQCDGGSDLIARLLPGRYVLQWRTVEYATAPFAVDLVAGSARFDLVAAELAPLHIIPWTRDVEVGLRVFDSNGVELERVLYASPWPLRIDLFPGRLTVRATSVGGTPRTTESIDLAPVGARLIIGP